MNHTTIEKAPSACDTEGFDTNTCSPNYPTDGTQSKAIAPSLAPSPNKAAILAALAVLFDPADVFSIQSLNTKKQIKAAMGGTAK